MKIEKPEPSEVMQFRNRWSNKGYELINITSLCEFKLGCNGWCNSFNEPDEEFHHVQVCYREEIIANMTGDKIEVIDNYKYVAYSVYGEGFIIFRKVKQ